MASEWDKAQAAFKKLQPQIRKIEAAKGDTLIKTVKKALKAAWKDEDRFRDAFKAAKETGLKGKKPGDFMGHSGFKATLGTLTKTAEAHDSAVKVLQSLCDEAKALDKALIKLLGGIKKTITKGDREQARFQAGVQDAQARAKATANLIGKLTAPELFYGAQFDRVVDRIVNKPKKTGGPGGKAEKLIEQKERDKNTKAAVKLAQKVAQLCEAAQQKSEDDPKAALPYLKKAASLIKDLKAINTAYQLVKKKNAALIRKSRDKTKIVRVITAIARAHDLSARTYSDTLSEIKRLAA